MITLNGVVGAETLEFKLEHIDDIGTPDGVQPLPGGLGARHVLPLPVDEAGRLALGRHAQRHGRCAGLQASRRTGEVRNQFHHVIDIVPTILECAGLPAPDIVNGVTQKPLEGISMVYSFDDAAAPDRHTTQYFEMYGNRGIYHDGWSAVTLHSVPFHSRTSRLGR